MSLNASGPVEGGEIGDRRPLGFERIDRRASVDMTDCHAANHQFIRRNVELRADDRMKIGKAGLWAGMKPAPPRGNHDGADEDAEIEPAADFEVFIQRENHSGGCAE